MTFKLPLNIDTRPFAVLGAGTLGRRIALMLATQGGEVRLYDPAATSRDEGVAAATRWLPDVVKSIPNGKVGRIIACEDLDAALADVWHVVEAAPENLELKLDLFRQIDALAPADAILASNSSSFVSREFADSVAQPERLLNTH